MSSTITVDSVKIDDNETFLMKMASIYSGVSCVSATQFATLETKVALVFALALDGVRANQSKGVHLSTDIHSLEERATTLWMKKQQAAFEAARDEKQMAAKVDFHARKYADEIAVALANNPTITKDALVSALQKQLVQAQADVMFVVDDVEAVAKRLAAGKTGNV